MKIIINLISEIPFHYKEIIIFLKNQKIENLTNDPQTNNYKNRKIWMKIIIFHSQASLITAIFFYKIYVCMYLKTWSTEKPKEPHNINITHARRKPWHPIPQTNTHMHRETHTHKVTQRHTIKGFLQSLTVLVWRRNHTWNSQCAHEFFFFSLSLKNQIQ